MIVKNYEEVLNEDVKMEGVRGATVRWLIGEDSSAPNFHMRLFTLEPNGHTPFHAHNYEHEIYVVSGSGKLNSDNGPVQLETGSFALINPNEKHQFENTGNQPFKFLCMIPRLNKCS